MDVLIFIFGLFCVVLAVIVAVAVGNVESKDCYRGNTEERPQSGE